MTIAEPDLADRQRRDSPFLLHRVRVARRRVLSPGFARLTFAGPTLHRFADPGLDQRIKLVLPAADGTLDLPFSDDWYGAWRALPEERRPVIRTYTTRAVRPGEVDVDLVLHEPCGPAGRFAQGCEEGAEAVLLGPNTEAAQPGGGIDFRLPASARRVLVAGDETALPAIARILDGLPADVGGTVLVEVPDARDADQLPSRAGVEVRVLVRGGHASGGLLHDAAREAALGMRWTGPREQPEDVDVDAAGGMLWEVPGDGAIPATDGPCYAWIAGEAGMVKTLRRVLVGEVGMDRRAVAFMGYWRAGRAEGA